jgi:hypothetical protein
MMEDAFHVLAFSTAGKKERESGAETLRKLFAPVLCSEKNSCTLNDPFTIHDL